MSTTPARSKRTLGAAALAFAALAVPSLAIAPAASASSAPQPTDPLTVAYIEVNSTDLSVVGDYELEDGSNAFDVAIIFAANINHDGTGATLHLNERVQATLDDAENQIRPLQDKGIKVTLSLLGNHQAAGFANFPTKKAATRFAREVAEVVETYDLDGVDIDDEWVQYGTDGVPAANDRSAAWLVKALDAELPKDSIISLYDIGETAETLKDAPHSVLKRLDYIWNPYYGQYNVPEFPVDPARLGAAAIDVGQTSPSTSASLAARTVADGFGVFVTYNLTAGDQSDAVSAFTRELNGQEAVYTG
jgi:hypothetical protein